MTRPQKMYRATLIMSESTESTESTESLAGLKWYPVGIPVSLDDSNKTRVWLELTTRCPVEGGPKGSHNVKVAMEDYVDRGVSNPKGCRNNSPKEIVLLNPTTGKEANRDEKLEDTSVLVYRLKEGDTLVYFVTVEGGSEINFDMSSDSCVKNFDRVEDDKIKRSYVLYDENPLRPDSKTGCATMPGFSWTTRRLPPVVKRVNTETGGLTV